MLWSISTTSWLILIMLFPRKERKIIIPYASITNFSISGQIRVLSAMYFFYMFLKAIENPEL